MDLVSNLLLSTAFACLVIIVIGFYKPWIVLWWEDTQNRRKVLKVYGTGILIFMAGYFAVKMLM